MRIETKQRAPQDLTVNGHEFKDGLERELVDSEDVSANSRSKSHLNHDILLDFAMHRTEDLDDMIGWNSVKNEQLRTDSG